MGSHKEDWLNRVDELVIIYQDKRSKKAAALLIKAFSHYLTKYYRLLRTGDFDIKDKDLRRFVSLFMFDVNLRGKACKSFVLPDVQKEIYLTATFISDSLAVLQDNDIKNDIHLAFMKLADRYLKQSEKVNFAGYVYNAYKFELFRTIKVYTTDPLTCAFSTIIRFNEESYLDNDEEEPCTYEMKYASLTYDELDNDWMYGKSCHEMFSDLTPLERLILKRNYYEGLSCESISKQTGYHHNTIQNKKQRAKEKLLEYAKKHSSEVGDDLLYYMNSVI
jgi:hypothetical protein